MIRENSSSGQVSEPKESSTNDGKLESVGFRLEQLNSQLRDDYPLKHATATIQYRLAPHARMLERLHYKTSRRPIPPLPENYNASVILQRISDGCRTPEIASFITRSLIAYARSKDCQITALRASTIFWFTDDNASWTVVEWVEGGNYMCLAIFHFEDLDELEQGSWLMHSGQEVASTTAETKYWDCSRIDWNVADVNHLKILFGAAQHIIGMLEWSVEDAMKLYCKQNTDEVSASEMVRLAKLLHNHVLQIKLLNAAFDKVSHPLQMFGQQNDNCVPNITSQWRLGMSLHF